jgi:hypothetical protein
MTVYELAAFPILTSTAIAAIITIRKDVVSSALSISSATTLGERSGGNRKNDRHAQSKSY